MKKILEILSILFFLITFLWMAKVLFNNGYPDFSNFYFGPKMAFDFLNPYIGGVNMFTPTTYPPFMFLLFYPLTLLPFVIAGKIWTLGSIAALLCSIYLLFKIYKQKVFSPVSLVLSGLVFLSFPIKFTLGMGQINMYILLLLVVFIYLLNKSKAYSGVFLAFSVLLKLFPIFLILYIFFIKKWKTFFYFFLTFCFATLLVLLVIKPEIYLYYIQKIFPSLLDSWKGDYYNQSLSGFLTRAVSNQELRIILRDSISLLLIAITFVFILLRKAIDNLSMNLQIGLVIVLNLLVNSFSWQHHFAWIVIPFFTTFFYLRSKNANLYQYLLLGVCYILISWNFKNPQEFPVILQSHVFFGALLLWIMQAYLLTKTTKKILIVKHNH